MVKFKDRVTIIVDDDGFEIMVDDRGVLMGRNFCENGHFAVNSQMMCEVHPYFGNYIKYEYDCLKEYSHVRKEDEIKALKDRLRKLEGKI